MSQSPASYLCTVKQKNNDYMNDNFAIQLFEGRQVRIVWDAEVEKYWFSIVDVVQVLTDSADGRKYWNKPHPHG